MTYQELSREERDARQDLWVEVLNPYCPANEITGNRPCDNGCPCDRCHYDPVLQLRYLRRLKEAGLTLTDKEVLMLQADS